MLSIIHPRYAVKVNELFIKHELLMDFSRQINFEEQLYKTNKIWFSSSRTSLVNELCAQAGNFIKQVNLHVAKMEYFIWRTTDRAQHPHIDYINTVLSDSETLNLRLNVPVISSGAVMEWYPVTENSKWVPTNDEEENGKRLSLDITGIDPCFTMSADSISFVNTSLPHTINMSNAVTDRLTVSFIFVKNPLFTNLINQIIV